ncbi:MAG: hypothetical protein R3E53_05525 [Myxococcota bacterium]
MASPDSVGETFELRGEVFDVASEWPALKGHDLVIVCTRGGAALEIVREALRAGVPCLDCTGALVDRPEVPLARLRRASGAEDEALAEAPLLALPSPTLAWARVLEALSEAAGVRRVVGTVLSSAGLHGRSGLASLSEESIALFNQSETPETGPAGQPVAFDVIPGGGVDTARVRQELARLFGTDLAVDVFGVQVPTFVGEGSALGLELDRPIERDALVERLTAAEGLVVVPEGPGARGLEVVPESLEEGAWPAGPTLRDALGSGDVLVGRIEPAPAWPAGQGFRLWLATDPLRLAAEQALRLAALRLGLD